MCKKIKGEKGMAKNKKDKKPKDIGHFLVKILISVHAHAKML